MKYFEMYASIRTLAIHTVYEIEFEKETEKYIFGKIKQYGSVRFEKAMMGKPVYTERNAQFKIQVEAADKDVAIAMAKQIMKEYCLDYINKL